MLLVTAEVVVPAPDVEEVVVSLEVEVVESAAPPPHDARARIERSKRIDRMRVDGKWRRELTQDPG